MRTISQRELRNDSAAVMRELDRGESFVVTRNGIPVGELRPIGPRRFVGRDAAIAAMRGAPRVDAAWFREDVDGVLDQDPTPRG